MLPFGQQVKNALPSEVNLVLCNFVRTPVDSGFVYTFLIYLSLFHSKTQNQIIHNSADCQQSVARQLILYLFLVHPAI